MSSLRFEVLRPDDLVHLQFDAFNLRLDTTTPGSPRLVVVDATQHAYLVVRFPAQSIAEKAYFETAAHVSANPPFNDFPPPPALGGADDPLDPAGSVPRRMAAASRLVFRLPQGLTELPFSLEALLDWNRLELVLSKTALGQEKPPPLEAPALLETALELPYRLVISPAKTVGWVHARLPQSHAGWTELWHTRLARIRTSGATTTLEEAGDANTIPIRAIWSPDFEDHKPLPLTSDTTPFLSSLSRRDRAQLVILTSGSLGYFVPGHAGEPVLKPIEIPLPSLDGPWTPQPAEASRLFLSALGGWLTARGSWPTLPSYQADDGSPQSLDLTEWRHIATQGRDHYVRVVYDGYLYPFGHRASLVKVTERKVVPADGAVVTTPTAYLKQHMYIVVREREKRYDGGAYLHDGREMPFLDSVRIETVVTPDIDKPVYLPEGTSGTSATPSSSFWIDVGGSGFPFHVTALDAGGSRVDLFAQLIFMSVSEPSLAAVQAAYRAGGDRRPSLVHGQKIAYADPSAGDTTLRTTALVFDTQPLQPNPPYPVAPFLPFLDQASVTVPALEQLLGTSTGVDVKLYDGYLGSGLDAHAGVFVEIAGAPPDVSFTADKAGGFATPNLALTALSARKGLVAGPAADAAAGVIDPAAFFGGVSVPGKIFGTIPLATLIPIPASGKADASRNAPEIRTHLVPNTKNPTSVVTNVEWQPDLKDYNEGPVTLQFNQNGTSALTLKAKIERSLTGTGATSDIDGELTSFQIALFDVIALNVDSIHFSSKNGSKTDVKANLPSSHPVVFTGPLSFVQALADVLPPGIFGGAGPSIRLRKDGVQVSYTLGLPPISIGVFSLEHISITTGLDLPYIDGKPAFEFAFAKRNAPFLITVECLGGGGFVHLVVDADGVEMVEGALEFGGKFSLDLGVASGGVHVMAGIYFKLTGTSSDLTGFVDIGGEVSVLGIISVSIDLNLTLTYQVSNGKEMVQGRATLTVSIHVLFFSTSVQLSVEKSFGKSPGDPLVQQVISAADWATYAAAYA
jgi:hypothetical protein